MAGRLTISTLNDDTGVLATQNGMSGIAKAWVNFNGTTTPPTIRAAMNVGSITKNGSGDYTLNFTTAMPDANYAVTGTTGTAQGYFFQVPTNLTAPTASAIRIRTSNDAFILTDYSHVFTSIFR